MSLTPEFETCPEYNEPKRTQSVINFSAVKEYALKCSKERRAGKFERVSETFLEECEAETERIIRSVSLNAPCYSDGPTAVKPADDREFITGAALEKIRQRLNERVRAAIQGKVQRHPSMGKTLQGQ